jgi:hypothetical protein
MNFYETPSFKDFSMFWQALIIIGFISTVIFTILLIIAISLMFETKTIKKEIELEEFDDFLNEFEKKEVAVEVAVDSYSQYPVLPKIKDLRGNYLLNLLDIKIMS